MKRAGRWLFNFAAAVSVVVFLFALWSWFSDRFQVRAADTGVVLIHAFVDDNYRGNSDVFHTPLSPASMDFFRQKTRNDGGSISSWLGFEYMRLNKDRMLVLPYWFLLSLSAVVPAIWLWRRNRLHARQAGHLCITCGYDLRATPGRCPECGTVPC